MPDRVYFIAEAGVNHNGDVNIAKKMLASPNVTKVRYQIKNTKKSGSQLDMLQKLELSKFAHKKLFYHAKNRGIEFLSSPFDLQSLEFLIKLGVRKIKISSGEMFNGPLIWQATKYGVPLIISRKRIPSAGGVFRPYFR